MIIGKQRERQPSKKIPQPEQRISEPGNTGSREKGYNFTKHPQKQRFSAFPASPEIAPNGSAFLFGNQLVLKTDPSVQGGRTLTGKLELLINSGKRNCLRWQWGTRQFPRIGFAVFAKFSERLCWFLSRKHLLKNICFLIGISYLLKVLSTEYCSRPNHRTIFLFGLLVTFIQDQKVLPPGIRDACHLQFCYQKAERDAMQIATSDCTDEWKSKQRDQPELFSLLECRRL